MDHVPSLGGSRPDLLLRQFAEHRDAETAASLAGRGLRRPLRADIPRSVGCSKTLTCTGADSRTPGRRNGHRLGVPAGRPAHVRDVRPAEYELGEPSRRRRVPDGRRSRLDVADPHASTPFPGRERPVFSIHRVAVSDASSLLGPAFQGDLRAAPPSPFSELRTEKAQRGRLGHRQADGAGPSRAELPHIWQGVSSLCFRRSSVRV